MRSGRRSIVAVASLVVVAIVAATWWLEVRTRADAVGPRFVRAVLDRHPGATVDAWNAGVLRLALPSGVYVDARLRPVFDACRARRFSCSDAIDRAVDDVDRTDRATRSPDRALLRAAVVAEALPGANYGFVAEPLIGALELRYVLAIGIASTFVTGTIADRLGMDRAALKTAAIDAMRADRTFAIEPLDRTAPVVFRVVAADDPVAALADPERMKQLAARLGAHRLVAVVAGRESLYVAAANEDGVRALKGLPRAVASQGGELLAYDIDAADRAPLTVVP